MTDRGVQRDEMIRRAATEVLDLVTFPPRSGEREGMDTFFDEVAVTDQAAAIIRQLLTELEVPND